MTRDEKINLSAKIAAVCVVALLDVALMFSFGYLIWYATHSFALSLAAALMYDRLGKENGKNSCN